METDGAANEKIQPIMDQPGSFLACAGEFSTTRRAKIEPDFAVNALIVASGSAYRRSAAPAHP